jgi:hypothetical protein
LAEILLENLLAVLQDLISVITLGEQLFFSLVLFVQMLLLQSLLLYYFLDLVVNALEVVVDIEDIRRSFLAVNFICSGDVQVFRIVLERVLSSEAGIIHQFC